MFIPWCIYRIVDFFGLRIMLQHPFRFFILSANYKEFKGLIKEYEAIEANKERILRFEINNLEEFEAFIDLTKEYE